MSIPHCILLIALLASPEDAQAPPPPQTATPTLPPEGCVRLLREARIQRMLGQVDEARASLWRAVEEYPQQLVPLLGLNSFNRRHPLPPDQLERYRSALHQRLLDPDYALSFAGLRFLVEDRDAGEADLELRARGIESRLARDPKSVTLLDALAELWLQLDRPVEARAIIGRLRAVDPTTHRRWQALWLDLELERWENALALIREGLAEDPRDLWLRSLLLENLSRTGRIDELLKELETLDADRLPVSAGSLLVAAAWTLRDQGRDDEAEQVFRQLLRIQPDNEIASAAMLYLYAAPEERQRHADRLAAHWQQSDDPDELLTEGAARLASGDAETAHELLERAAALQPLNELTWVNLGLALIQLERWPNAVAALERARKLNPARPETLANLGAALANTDRCEEAVTVLEQARVDRPQMRLIDYYLYTCYRKLGRMPEATEALTRYKAE